MSYRLLTFFTMIWGIMALLGAIMSLDSTPAADDPTRQAVDSMLNPEIVSIDAPTFGEGSASNPVSAGFEAGKHALGWLVFVARAATLSSPIWQGDLEIIRAIGLLMGAPFMWMMVKETAKLLLTMTRGLGGVFGGITRLFGIG